MRFVMYVNETVHTYSDASRALEALLLHAAAGEHCDVSTEGEIIAWTIDRDEDHQDDRPWHELGVIFKTALGNVQI